MPARSNPEVRAASAGGRRDELLRIAAQLFAERGYRNTTVRDIADAAGILSGSLYHHFDSKEAIVDEVLSTFQGELFAAYDEILAGDRPAREKIEEAVRVAFDAMDRHRHEMAILQNEADHLSRLARFGHLQDRNRHSREVWTTLLRDGVAEGGLRADLDIDIAHRFIRDTVWVAARWCRPGGGLSPDQAASQYLAILFDGIAS